MSILVSLATLSSRSPIYSSESDCKEPNVKQEPESRSITDLCTKLHVALERLVASQTVKMNTDPEPLVLVKPDVLEKPGSKVVVKLEHELEPNNTAKPEPELESAGIDEPKPEPDIVEPLVETSADLSAKLVIDLVPPTPAVRVPVTLRSPALYDSLQFLHETGS